MTYTVVENFKAGLDTRRLRATSEAGTLIELKNAHINQGGEIEKRKAFDLIATLPAGTYGAFGLGDDIWVFGSIADPGVPAGFRYQQLAAPDGFNMIRVLDVDQFAGRLYVVAEYADGDIHHFYDGVRIADWDDGRANGSFTITGGGAASPATAEVVSLAFTSTGAIRPGTITLAGVNVTLGGADVANLTSVATKVAEVLGGYVPAQYTSVYSAAAVVQVEFPPGVANPAHTFGADGALLTWPGSGTNLEAMVTIRETGTDAVPASTMTSVTVGGVEVLRAPVAWVDSPERTAEAIAAQINKVSSTPNWTATRDGATVILKAGDRGAARNGLPVAYAVADGLTVLTGVSPTTGGSETAGTYQPGPYALAARSKVYSLSGDLLHFSALNDPTIVDTADTGGVGQGFIDMTTQASGSDNLQAVTPYFNFHAVFGKRTVQMWQFDVDPNLNALAQVLSNTGTLAPRSVVSFGANDVFYLGSNGVRSLRARDTSTSAAVTDVGSPVDSLLLEHILGDYPGATAAKAAIEPTEGRYLLAIRDKIYVFSYFPGGRVSAWSTYEPGFNVDHMTIAGDRLVVRSGDNVYLYGGLSGLIYDNSEVVVRLPYLDAGKPAHTKPLMGVDAAAEGAWEVYLGVNPDRPEVLERVGALTNTSHDDPHLPLQAEATHFSLEFRHQVAEPARLGQVVIHHTFGDAQ